VHAKNKYPYIHFFRHTSQLHLIDFGAGFIVTTDAVNVFGKDISGSISEQNVVSFTVKGVGDVGNHFAYSESNGKSAFTCHINLKQPGFQSTVLFLGYK